ncbi:UV-damage endonuclease [Purpureocillium lavendulum]|uniref:UV-damage endonuclease n=1 Tax=Purpureocillium lavendulum TaxID=1247861 RepID=A0AB34FLP2_9HYPO|nr:UV-damage endonuclease [Purpureocillium lavendulum]
MPPKRKRPVDDDTEPPPRRSSRKAKEADAVLKAASGKTGLLDDSSPKARRAVERAMLELTEMEHKLQDDTRRQRLAVQTSDFGVDPHDATHVAFQTKSSRPADEMVPPTALGEADGTKSDNEIGHDAECVADVKVDDEGDIGLERGARRPPPVNSEKLPLPWSGRLGYPPPKAIILTSKQACLNTYLRSANPPVFSSRTCRISSILEHRHALHDPSQPEHPTKNRPDTSKPADVSRGLQYVQDLGLANARDIAKMLRWNDKYGIKFMRLSSEMFPFASHDEYGYKLAPFASGVLAESGRVAAELGHRVTTHPGQFTQLGSPRKEVVRAAIRDLDYHDEMLTLLKLPDQLNRDAVMILHMGGVFGDKEATLNRFRENYALLSESVQRRLVLENDDVSWSVHDLLPICEELNIPLVLDYHHHNIVFDPCMREGTLDIMQLYDRIRATWTRKHITQKMHYSESTAAAVTPRERRKHSARVKTLPPCPPDMDLMIEAKDKEQAVFELMRTFRLPGWDRFNAVVPHDRDDEPRKAVVRKAKGKKKGANSNGDGDEVVVPERTVASDKVSMGGPEGRVYWPEGMEEWLRPKKREVKKKTADKDE